MSMFRRGLMAAEASKPKDSKYLTIVPLEDGFKIKLSNNSCFYRVDGGEWISLNKGTYTPEVNVGHVIEFKGEITPVTSWPYGIGNFTATKNFDLQGNCMSMIFGDNADGIYDLTGYSHAFYQLFRLCTQLISVSENFLPATILSENCYYGMFEGCKNLINTPKLPATILSTMCYSSMFSSCSAITKAPKLAVTNLESSCYTSMFSGCSSLNEAPELPAEILSTHCYQYMFKDCTSLTKAPVLPALELLDYSYYAMFRGCTNLSYVKAMFLTTPGASKHQTEYWLENVSSTGTFVKNANATWDVTGVNGIPEGWTVQTATS